MWGMPAWLLWTSIGSAATMGWNKLQQAGRAPGAAAGKAAPKAIPFPLNGPPPARPGTPSQFDPHMDERTERAVMRCIQEGDPVKLRGFADSITTQLPAQFFPMGYFPVAAHIMRARAQQVELGRAAAAHAQAQAAAAPPAPAAAPAPAPAPQPAAKHVNGAAAPAAVVADKPEPSPAPEV